MEHNDDLESQRISQLIACVAARRATDSQRAELDGWLARSPRNRELFDSIIAGEDPQQRDKLRAMMDKERSWRRIQARSAGRSRRMRIIRGAAAAAVLLLAAAGGLWYMLPGPDMQTQQRPNQTIPSALLITGDGEQIALDDLTEPLAGRDDRVMAAVGENSLDYTQAAPLAECTNTLHVRQGGRYRVVLSDGTEVWVNAGSRLSYPVRFSGTERRVTLEGEACFEVASDREHPFIVETADGTVTVLGTRFNVKAYADQPGAVTTLLRGSVEVSSGVHTRVLSPGEQAAILPGGGIAVQQVDAELYASWVDGILYFHSCPLDEVLRTLSRVYGTDYRFADDALGQITYTGRLDCNNPVEYLLELLSSTGSVTLTMDEGSNITISHKKE